MRKRLATVSILTVMAILTSACWQISAARMNPTITEYGKITLDLRGWGDGGTFDEKAFVLVGYNNINPRIGRVFDKDGNFGGPWDGDINNTMRNVLVGGTSSCATGGVNIGDFEASFTTWRAYVSPVAIDMAANNNARLIFQHGVQRGTFNGIGQIIVASGIWSDNGNDIPEAGELICGGVAQLGTNYVD